MIKLKILFNEAPCTLVDINYLHGYYRIVQYSSVIDGYQPIMYVEIFPMFISYK